LFQLGVVYLEQGLAPQALAYLDKALEFDPEHEQALLNSAILLQELGREELRKVARERLLKLLKKVRIFLLAVKATLFRCNGISSGISVLSFRFKFGTFPGF